MHLSTLWVSAIKNRTFACLALLTRLKKAKKKLKIEYIKNRPSTKSRTHYLDVFYHDAKNKIYNSKSPDVSNKLRMERVPELFSDT